MKAPTQSTTRIGETCVDTQNVPPSGSPEASKSDTKRSLSTQRWSIGLGLTGSCMMNCGFCYSKSKRQASRDLRLSQWIKFVDGNIDWISAINYGTGENSVRPDWFDFIKHVRTNYPWVQQSLTTNGYLAVAARERPGAKALLAAALDEVDVSLDFHDAKRHNEFRGATGAYEWSIGTLELCNDLGITPTIVCLGTEKTFDPENLDGLFDIARKFKAMVRINIFRPMPSMGPSAARYLLEQATLIRSLYRIADRHDVLWLGDQLLAAVLTDRGNCPDPSGASSLRILPDGTITPSTYLIEDRFVAGHIDTPRILRQLKQSAVFSQVSGTALPDYCAGSGCPFLSRCQGGCKDRRYLWYGTLAERDPYCPFRPGNILGAGQIQLSRDTEWHSVHAGYLPTMLFSPRR